MYMYMYKYIYIPTGGMWLTPVEPSNISFFQYSSVCTFSPSSHSSANAVLWGLKLLSCESCQTTCSVLQCVAVCCN